MSRKESERIIITVGGETIVVSVAELFRNRVVLGFEASSHVKILREEVVPKNNGHIYRKGV